MTESSSRLTRRRPARIDHRAFKNRLYDQFARIGKALGNSHRLEILDLLAQGERTVEDLAAQAGISVANASQHLQVLRTARLIEARRDGPFVHYRLAGEDVFRLWKTLRDLGAERLAEVDRVVETFLADRGGTEPIDAEELARRIEDGDLVLIDVRPEHEFRAGHIPGARSVTVDRLTRAIRSLPRDLEVIAYCRGPYCIWADEAVALLTARGYRARRLADGFPDWRAAGLPVEASTERTLPRERETDR